MAFSWKAILSFLGQSASASLPLVADTVKEEIDKAKDLKPKEKIHMKKGVDLLVVRAQEFLK